MKKIQMLWLSCCMVIVLLVVSACSNQSGTTPGGNAPAATGGSASEGGKSNDAPVELRMGWWGSATQEVTLQALKLFEERHPGITIKGEFAGTGYWDKLSTQIAGSNAPDIIQMDIAQLSEYAKRGALLDLTPYAGDTIHTADFDKDMIDLGTIDGKLYALSLGANTYSMFYNATVLKELNIPEPQPTWTWDDFVEMNNKIGQMKNGFYGTLDQSSVVGAFEVFVRQHGGPLYENGKFAASKEILVKWFEMWENMRQNGGATPPDVTANIPVGGGEHHRQPLPTGKVAMQMIWSNNLYSYNNMMKDSVVGIQILPNGKDEVAKGGYIKPSQLLSANSKTKHPKETAMVIDFLLNDPDATAILGALRGVPSTSKVRAHIKPLINEHDARTFDYIETARGFTRKMDPPYPVGSSEVSEVFATVNEEVAFGVKKPAEAAEYMINEANKILSKQQ